jgi:hypothetical protein
MGEQIQAFGDRLKRGLSNERAVRGGELFPLFIATPSLTYPPIPEQSQNEQERSLSRGRRGRDFVSYSCLSHFWI